MWTNVRTGKGWTDAEETTFAEIMRTGNLTRIKAIQLFKRCKSNPARALELARENYGRSEARTASYERSKAARLAGLVKATAARSQNATSIRAECPAWGFVGDRW